MFAENDAASLKCQPSRTPSNPLTMAVRTALAVAIGPILPWLSHQAKILAQLGHR